MNPQGPARGNLSWGEHEDQILINLFEEGSSIINFDLPTEDKGQTDLSEDPTLKDDQLFNEQEDDKAMSFDIKEVEAPVVHVLELDENDLEANLPEEIIPELKDEREVSQTPIKHGISAEQMAIRSRERMDRLRDISFKLRTPSGLTDLENEPAYKRRNVDLEEVTHSSESEVAQYTLNEDNDNNLGIKPNNFLHDNID